MKVKELIEKLEKLDSDKDVIVRFAVSSEDEIGYVLIPVTTGQYIDEAAIYAEYIATKEDCEFIGQKDLKELWVGD